MTGQIPQGAQEYLETIFEMEEEGGKIQQSRIAKRLGVSASSASEQVHRLQKEELIEISGREISLTEGGRTLATPLVRRHRLAERLLTDILEIPWYRAHEEAHAWEHVMSPEVEERILAKTGARTCPHGNPIPGEPAPYDRSKLVSLADLNMGQTGILSLLTEDVELDTEVLKYFEDHGLMPGARVTVVAIGPDGTLTLGVDEKAASLGKTLADNIWLLPE